MRAALIIAIIVVLGFAYHLFTTASQKKPTGRETIQPEQVSETVQAFERRIAKDKVSSVKLSDSVADRPSTKVANGLGVDPRVEPPAGPFDVSLGQHTVHFRNHPGHAMKLRLSVVVNTSVTRKEVLLNRRKLTRMLYFLGSKRRLGGARGDAGRDRLISDLASRFSNVIKTGSIDAVRVDDYEIVEVPRSDDE